MCGPVARQAPHPTRDMIFYQRFLFTDDENRSVHDYE